jgi:LacI family transcriptional regulator
MITVKDVAKQAQVSVGTVSNALTRRRPVSEETRQRVLKAIEELGYQPNLVARSLIDRRSYTLAVVTGRLEYYGGSRTLVGIESGARALGYSVLLHLIRTPTQADLPALLSALTSRRVDGVIWAVPELATQVELPLPMIFLFMPPQPGRSVVTMEHRAGAVLATQHLLDQGRRKIGLVNGPLTWWVARERQAGWQETLKHAGRAADESLIVHGDWSAASGEQRLAQLLEQQPDIDAVLAGNDQMALGVLRAAHLRGRRIPEDLAVVGFDNTPESALYWPALTTVHLRHVEIGRIAVEQLVGMIEARQSNGHGEPVTVMLKPELVVRESSVTR